MKLQVIQCDKAIDQLLSEWRMPLGHDFMAYRNHVYRVFNLAMALAAPRGPEVDKLAIAAAFHDIGIWLDNSFDYLEPSIARAKAYLGKIGCQEWNQEMANIIRQHHKLTPWHGKGQRLVEAFRRADWLDVCLFALPTKHPSSFLRELLSVFPRARFHLRLLQIAGGWVRRHPLRPLPMFKL